MTHACYSSGSNCSQAIDGLNPMLGEPGNAIIEAEAPLKESGACVIQDHVFLKHNWYGYLAILKLVPDGGKVYFKFSYPQERCCLKMLIYLTEQVDHLRKPMNCLQKQAVLDPKSSQVITLSPSSKHSGCKTVTNEEGELMLECRSGRILRSNKVREWYIAVSNCGSPSGLDFHYSLIVFGNLGECPESKTDCASTVIINFYFMTMCLLLAGLTLL